MRELESERSFVSVRLADDDKLSVTVGKELTDLVSVGKDDIELESLFETVIVDVAEVLRDASTVTEDDDELVADTVGSGV